MQDVNIVLPNSDEHEQTDVDLDDAQCNAASDHHDSDSDAGLNDSEDEDLDVTARMLSDEVSSILTWSTSLILIKKLKVASLVNNQKPCKSSKVSKSDSHGTGCLSAGDQK
jgi:hypothetical protein